SPLPPPAPPPASPPLLRARVAASSSRAASAPASTGRRLLLPRRLLPPHLRSLRPPLDALLPHRLLLPSLHPRLLLPCHHPRRLLPPTSAPASMGGPPCTRRWTSSPHSCLRTSMAAPTTMMVWRSRSFSTRQWRATSPVRRAGTRKRHGRLHLAVVAAAAASPSSMRHHPPCAYLLKPLPMPSTWRIPGGWNHGNCYVSCLAASIRSPRRIDATSRFKGPVGVQRA
ncbi:unnamed protein product, partial [Urochloa humidicola]